MSNSKSNDSVKSKINWDKFTWRAGDVVWDDDTDAEEEEEAEEEVDAKEARSNRLIALALKGMHKALGTMEQHERRK